MGPLRIVATSQRYGPATSSTGLTDSMTATPTATQTPSARRWYGEARNRAAEFQLEGSATPKKSGSMVEPETEAFLVLVAAALCLTALNFGATTQPNWFVDVVNGVGLESLSLQLGDAFFESDDRRFNGLIFWASMQILSYVVLPSLLIRLVFRRSLADYGLGLRPSRDDVAPYLVLLAIAAPFVAVASTTAAFQAKYPFLDLAVNQPLWPQMYVWWLLYAAQFVALEFFFRGFLIHGLVRSTGMLAVPIMVVPYTMLHFDKPGIEAVAAIVGGLVLGTLALKTKTVWWGALLHISVAMIMDVLAIGWARW